MRVLALDIGCVRCGIAVSDPAGAVATPVCVLPTSEVLAHAVSFRRVLEDWEPDMIVAGLPLSLSGAQGEQAKRIKSQAVQIAEQAGLPLEYTDERLSSREAKRFMREAGATERSMRGKVDSIAASIFLQAWLDKRKAHER